ncbi:MAG: hypothetical protein PVH24_07975, partial [Candidatus Zixiibacteriota bacterium]|jgi:tetratricopeptide (TPR) repeat protein
LAVDFVLEGTIRWDKTGEVSVVRVTPQLIQADGDIHLWSKSYDEAITNVFAVQSHIAGQIASVLDIQITASEEVQITHVPTENMEAYDYYLRGNDYLEHRRGERALRISIQLFQKAIELDPRFAMAYIQLSMAHTRMIWNVYDMSDARFDSAQAAITIASEISPDIPEIHLARGLFYFQGIADYTHGLQELQIATRKLPNNSQAICYTASALAHLGRWEEAEREYKKAVAMDPRDVGVLRGYANLLRYLHRFHESDSLYGRIIELQPDDELANHMKILLSILLTGNTEKGRRILTEARNRTGLDLPCISWWLEIMDRDYESALSILMQHETWDCSFLTEHEWYIQTGDCYRFLNQDEQAKLYYDSARVLIENEVDKATIVQSWNRACLAYVYAALDRKEDAIREGKLSIEVWPVSEDAVNSPDKHEWLAKTYTLIGEYDLAVEQLEYLASIPAGLLPLPFLKSAYFAPLQDNPRFQALIEKYETKQNFKGET